MLELAQLILSDSFSELSPETARTYLLLRADCATGCTAVAQMGLTCGEYVSGLSLDVIAKHLHSTVLTAGRCLDELVKRKLVVRRLESGSFVYLLGGVSSGWFYDSPPVPKLRIATSPSDLVRRAVAEGKSRIEAEEARRALRPSEKVAEFLIASTIGESFPNNHHAAQAVHAFERGYRTRYGEEPPKPDAKSPGDVIRIFSQRGLKWCKGNLQEYRDMIEWGLENWVTLVEAGHTDQPRMTYHALGSTKILRLIQEGLITGKVPVKKKKSGGEIAEIRRHFERRHTERWGYYPRAMSKAADSWGSMTIPERAAMVAAHNKMAAFLWSFVKEDKTEALRLIDLMYDNWDNIRLECKWEIPSPTYELMRAEKFLGWLQSRIREDVDRSDGETITGRVEDGIHEDRFTGVTLEKLS